jgi:sugar phosphate isomerase/epimerase
MNTPIGLFHQSDVEDLATMLVWFRDLDDALRIRVAAAMPGATDAERDERLERLRRDTLRSVRSLAVELGVECYVNVTPETLGVDASTDSAARQLARVVLAKLRAKKEGTS